MEQQINSLGKKSLQNLKILRIFPGGYRPPPDPPKSLPNIFMLTIFYLKKCLCGFMSLYAVLLCRLFMRLLYTMVYAGFMSCAHRLALCQYDVSSCSTMNIRIRINKAACRHKLPKRANVKNAILGAAGVLPPSRSPNSIGSQAAPSRDPGLQSALCGPMLYFVLVYAGALGAASSLAHWVAGLP